MFIRGVGWCVSGWFVVFFVLGDILIFTDSFDEIGELSTDRPV